MGKKIGTFYTVKHLPTGFVKKYNSYAEVAEDLNVELPVVKRAMNSNYNVVLGVYELDKKNEKDYVIKNYKNRSDYDPKKDKKYQKIFMLLNKHKKLKLPKDAAHEKLAGELFTLNLARVTYTKNNIILTEYDEGIKEESSMILETLIQTSSMRI